MANRLEEESKIHGNHRPFWTALVFEKDGDLNLTWLFVFLLGMIGAAGFVHVVIFGHGALLAQIAAWSFLGGTLASMLIAAIPLSKAKILARATLPGEIAKSISSVVIGSDPGVSTDIQELSQRQQGEDTKRLESE
jgi:hypothetical protein